MKFNKIHVLFAVIVISVLINAGLAYVLYTQNIVIDDLDVYRRAYGELEKLTGVGKANGVVHDHADFKVFINGKEIAVYKPENMHKNTFIHMHGPEDGASEEYVIHIHAAGVSLSQFFTTIGMSATNDCFSLEGQTYCTTGSKVLKYYVNGVLSNEMPYGDINDKDKILVSYGNESISEISKQQASILNNACVQSKNC